MDQSTLLAIFVGIAALALPIQAGMLFGIYRAFRSLEQKVTPLLPKVERLVETSQEAVEQSREQFSGITAKANEILDSTKRQLATVEEVVADASGRARAQLDRVELVLDDTMMRAQETVAMVHGGIMKPLREIQGIAAGLRTAFQYLLRGTRPSPAQATHDEEMFI